MLVSLAFCCELAYIFYKKKEEREKETLSKFKATFFKLSFKSNQSHLWLWSQILENVLLCSKQSTWWIYRKCVSSLTKSMSRSVFRHLDRRDTYSKSKKSRLESPLKWTIITTPHHPKCYLCPNPLHFVPKIFILFFLTHSLTRFHSPLDSATAVNFYKNHRHHSPHPHGHHSPYTPVLSQSLTMKFVLHILILFLKTHKNDAILLTFPS